jgi:hypothetical protein
VKVEAVIDLVICDVEKFTGDIYDLLGNKL